jgi:chorismate dehydratase
VTRRRIQWYNVPEICDRRSVPLLRIAASSYLNSAPLIWSFWHGPRQNECQLITDAAPARCADMLARGEAGAALIPVIEYQRLPGVAIVPDVCVGSRRAVRSVVLATKGLELKDVRRVAVDTSSRTSAALVKIIFREFVGREPEWRPAAPDLGAMLADADAALLIGDPAMTFPRENLRVYDMATLWREFTGHGFVFAMWAAGVKARKEAAQVAFAAARDEGVARIEEIAARYQPELGRPHAELSSYLRDNICFGLDEDLREGMRLYFTLAYRHRLIPAVKPLRWLGAK